MTITTTATFLGFAFVAAWSGLGFATAVLCLVGAALFRLAAGLLAGELEIDDLRDRLDLRGTRGRGPTTPRVR